MKDVPPLDLPFAENQASLASGPTLPSFEIWLGDRPELWSAGGDVQRELFADMLRARIGK